MKILFAGKHQRGKACLAALIEREHELCGVIAPPPPSPGKEDDPVALEAARLGLRLIRPADVNAPAVIDELRALAPALTVLGGYGQIVGAAFLALAPKGCLNLHAGRLPEYRGSSPLNWALINGESSFGLSVIQVDRGVDTGDVLVDRSFPIDPGMTIADLHRIANQAFPGMLIAAIEGITDGTLTPRRQDPARAAYHPLRFPEDGLVLWDLLTAQQVHDKIRALTDPYPGAFSYHRGRKVLLTASRMPEGRYHGEPGRVYLINHNGLLVCAVDQCVWIRAARFADTGEDAIGKIRRYERLATVARCVMDWIEGAADG